MMIVQTSVGGSLKAALDRLWGTLAGALYGAAVAVTIPHVTDVGLGLAIAAAILPLAYLAAVNPIFRVAPVTALIVMLPIYGHAANPFVSAIDRVIEIVIGNIVALAVTFVILPTRAHSQLREAAATMDAGEGSILAAARSVLAWHATHGFCAQCGAPSVPVYGGWKRLCSACGTEHFPRVSPVVIMLITRDDRVLLGRGPTWPERFYSCLAGFMEPGETIENAVRRETFEESGIKLGRVVYHASQPWPFPYSLMIGCFGEALNEDINLDLAELEDCRWFERGEVLSMLAKTHPTLLTPPPGAIAHHLIRAWAEAG